MIKNIALILAPSERVYDTSLNMPPLAIGVLQGYLKEQGFTVNAVDLSVSLKHRISKMPRETWLPVYDKDFVIQNLRQWQEPSPFTAALDQLLDDIPAKKADIFGCSLGANFSFFEIHTGVLVGKRLKDKYQKPVVFGGENIQYLLQFQQEFRELWHALHENFHYVFYGPGERAFGDLIHLLNGVTPKQQYKDLPGAVTWSTNGVIANVQDTPTIARPDFSGLELETYKLHLLKGNSGVEKLNQAIFFKWPFAHSIIASDKHKATLAEDKCEDKLFIPYIFNYNCPFRCAFCVQSSDENKEVIAKKPEAVVKDLEELMQQYDTKYFYFYNNNFNFTREFVREFCQLVEEWDLEFYWSDCARFNQLDKELLRMMYRAGCRKLVFGFETGSLKLLKLIDKRLDLDHARQVLKWCQEVGIWAELEVIIGLPYEFAEDFQATYDFVEENLDYITNFTVNKYFIIPSSLIGRFPERYGIELVRVQNRYEKVLEKNARLFLNPQKGQAEKVGPSNFQVFLYNELNGRTSPQIIKERQERVRRLSGLYKRLKTSDEIRIYAMVHSDFSKYRP